MEDTYLADLLKVIRKYFLLILILGILGGFVGKMVTSAPPPTTYESSTRLFIKNQIPDTNMANIQSDETKRFYNAATTLVNSPLILEKVKSELQLNESTTEISRKVWAGIINESYIIQISVNAGDPNYTTSLVNKITDVYKREIGNYLDVDTVEVIQHAESGHEIQKVNEPRTKSNIIMGSIIGLIIGIFLSFIFATIFRRSKA